MATKKPIEKIADLPKVGPNRFWRIAVDKKTPTKPIKVSLMEFMVVGRPGLATELNYERTIADRDSIKAAAEVVLDRIGFYASFIGDYIEEEESK